MSAFLSPTSSRLIPAPWSLLALIALVLAGCSATPTLSGLFQDQDAANTPCEQACALAYSQCESRQQVRITECQQHQQELRASYEACVNSGSTTCLHPDVCLKIDLKLCTLQRNECRARCAARAQFDSSAADTEDLKASAE